MSDPTLSRSLKALQPLLSNLLCRMVRLQSTTICLIFQIEAPRLRYLSYQPPCPSRQLHDLRQIALPLNSLRPTRNLLIPPRLPAHARNGSLEILTSRLPLRFRVRPLALHALRACGPTPAQTLAILMRTMQPARRGIHIRAEKGAEEHGSTMSSCLLRWYTRPLLYIEIHLASEKR